MFHHIIHVLVPRPRGDQDGLILALEAHCRVARRMGALERGMMPRELPALATRCGFEWARMRPSW
jgi:hypothetical protein